MRPEPDELLDERDTRPRGPAITLAGGLLLFICLFLPAVDSCGTPVRPIEMPWLAWPHFMGMLAAVGAALALWRDRRGPELIGLSLYLLALVATTGTGIASVAASHDYTGLFALPLLIAVVLVIVMRKRPWRAGRAVWICGLLSAPWLYLFTIDMKPLYGLWLALAGSCLMIVGGALWDLDEPARPGPDDHRLERDQPLPRARAIR